MTSREADFSALARAITLEIWFQDWLAEVLPGSDCREARQAFWTSAERHQRDRAGRLN